MDALTERTLQSLRERLKDFRTKGAIPALMAEFRIGAPAGETQPLHGFEDGLWAGALRQLPDGTQLSRSLWLAGDLHAAAEFRDTICLDVGRIVLPILYAAGYRVGLGSDKPQTRWLWAAFELAELRLSGTYLRLDGDTVWRVGADGVVVNEGMLADPGPFVGLAATAGDTRYWKLTNVVEASLAVLDIALLPQEPAAVGPKTATSTNSRPPRRDTRKKDVDAWLGKLEFKMRKDLTRELGCESAADEALISELYEKKSDNLALMLLDKMGFKVSGRTIRREGVSIKYAAWKQYHKKTAPASVAADLGPAGRTGVEEGEAPGPSRAMAAAAAVGSGQLSERVGGRGTTHTGKTAVEKATEDAADRFAREAGVDIPPAE